MHAPVAREGNEVGIWGAADVPADGRTARILARSMYRDLKSYGIANDKILEVVSEMIGLVTDELGDESPAP